MEITFEYVFCLIGWCASAFFAGVCFGYSVAKAE